ncbi:MAG TPA: DUF3572 domain-containing protein [Beijerinckiaceae bacterium]|nr:DUF3572 domain-containing protein [Beijerinckiaceae bacterium]
MKPPSPQAAEYVAVRALGFLASEPERIDRFLALSGLNPQNLRSAAAEPGFLAAVLDHVASDERLLLSFARSASLDPQAVALAREALSSHEWDEGA